MLKHLFNQMIWRPWVAFMSGIDMLDKNTPEGLKVEAMISRAAHALGSPHPERSADIGSRRLDDNQAFPLSRNRV
ncbi:MAG: hypothetical protein WA738_12700 [Candidatus Angelobacter sp.]